MSPPQKETNFCQYFLVTKTIEGLHHILDLRPLNFMLSVFRFRRQRSDTQEVSMVCFRAYQFCSFFWPGLGSPDVYKINGHGSCPVEAPGCACLARLKMWEVEVRADEKNFIYLIYRRKEKCA